MALSIRIAEFKSCQYMYMYQVRAVSPNLMLAKNSCYTVHSFTCTCIMIQCFILLGGGGGGGGWGGGGGGRGEYTYYHAVLSAKLRM